jgi:hypothetical protein
MRVDVIVMAGGGTRESIMDWQLKPDTSGQLCVRRKGVPGRTPAETWEELTGEINRRALAGRHSPVEIFLYLRDGLRGSLEEYDVLKDFVVTARRHALGGGIYVVWDAGALETDFYELDALNTLVVCFRGLLEERVTDIIEITRRQGPLGKLSLKERTKIIRGRTVSSQRRRERLKALASEGSWDYVLPNEARFLESFLSEFVRDGVLPPSGPNHLIIFDDAPMLGADELLSEFDKTHPGGRGVVAATLESYSALLKSQRAPESPRREVILFEGTLEAVYALLLLNDAGSPGARPKRPVAGEQPVREGDRADVLVEVKEVKLIKGPMFSAPAVSSPPRLLITSAFDGRQQSHRRREAAEIGALLRELPSLPDVEVRQYVDCESLPSLLESDQFTAWIHLGHGNDDGMYDSRLNLCLPPSRWLNCFKAYKTRSLKLALFSVCRSSPVAKLFARAGAGVAIGFKNEVLTDATEILVQKVVPAALRGGSDEAATLEAFRDACGSLAARADELGVSYIESRPVAFCPVRE